MIRSFAVSIVAFGLCITLSLCASPSADADDGVTISTQQATHADDSHSHSNDAPRTRYLLKLAVYDGPLKADAGESAGKPQLIESIQVSAMEGLSCSAQFGRQVSLTVGKVVSPRGSSKQTQQYSIGTLVEALIAPDELGAMMEIQFESSRLHGEGTEQSPPDILKTMVTTAVSVRLNEPTLIGSGTSEAKSYLYATVKEQK